MRTQEPLFLIHTDQGCQITDGVGGESLCHHEHRARWGGIVENQKETPPGWVSAKCPVYHTSFHFYLMGQNLAHVAARGSGKPGLDSRRQGLSSKSVFCQWGRREECLSSLTSFCPSFSAMSTLTINHGLGFVFFFFPGFSVLDCWEWEKINTCLTLM